MANTLLQAPDPTKDRYVPWDQAHANHPGPRSGVYMCCRPLRASPPDMGPASPSLKARVPLSLKRLEGISLSLPKSFSDF